MPTFNLQTLTPLHTGGVNTGQMDRIQETGILGSMRWWYEAVLRGLGGKVCDPTNPKQDKRCTFDDDEYERAKRKSPRQRLTDAGLCEVCQLFGATGWGRRFRLIVEEDGEKLWSPGHKIQVTAPNGNRGWHFYSPHISTTDRPIKIRIEPKAGFGASAQNDLAVLLSLISRWGSLGAKTQHGFGVVGVADAEGKEINPDFDLFFAEDRFAGNCSNDKGMPALSNMFFAKLYFKQGTPDAWWQKALLDSNKPGYRGVKDRVMEWRLDETEPLFSVPIAPASKYKLRFANNRRSYLQAASHKEDELFGFVKGNSRSKAKVNISSVYKEGEQWQFRLWGWLPQAHPQRGQLLEELRNLVTEDQGSFWKQIFNADLVSFDDSKWAEQRFEEDGQVFLRNLLKPKPESA